MPNTDDDDLSRHARREASKLPAGAERGNLTTEAHAEAGGEPASPARRRFLRRAAVGAAATLGGAWGVARANRLDVHVAPPVPRRKGGGEPLRIALLTDVHAPHDWFAFDELAAATRAFDPHLVLVVGDSINRRGDEHLVRAYDALPARLGKFAALGNWEYQGSCDFARLRAEYDRAGVRLLVNQDATVDHDGEPIRVVGLDDFLHGRPLVRMAGDGSAGSAMQQGRTLLLAHCPALFDAARRVTRASFTALGGHTHGGQIAPFGRAIITPPGSASYVKGWYEGGVGQRLYVSRGLGNSDIPFRIGSPPELALLTV